MNAVRFTFTFILASSIVCAFFLIIYSYKRRTLPGANYFILVMITAILYNGTYIGEINSTSLRQAMIWFDLEHIAIPLQHYLWFMMSIEYVRLERKKVRAARLIMAYHPVLYYIIYYTNNFHHKYISAFSFKSNGYFSVIDSTKEEFFTLMVISGTVLGIVATVLYIMGFLKTAGFQRYGYIVMIIASLLPWISVYLNATNKSYLGIDYFPVTTIISGILYTYGIFSFRLFKTIPIATEAVFRQSKEGIIIVDVTDCIIEVNNTILRLYPELHNINKKYNLTAFINMHPEYKPILDGRVRFEYKHILEDHCKYFAVEVNNIAYDNLNIGRFITVTDVTEYTESQMKLESMAKNALYKAETNEMSFLQAQISPHFINNTLSVIASMITRAPEQAKDLISNLGEYLSNSYYFDSESVMVRLDAELQTIETYVNIEKARFMERLSFHLICDNVPEIKIPRLIIQPLVENAIRHGILKKAVGGNVWLYISCRDGRVYFEIKDDGVGMDNEKVNNLTATENSIKSIGIVNINKRLLKHYNEGLKISSSVGNGTSVSFSIPYNEIE